MEEYTWLRSSFEEPALSYSSPVNEVRPDFEHTKKCVHCICAELWLNLKDTSDFDDCNLPTAIGSAASHQERIDAASALYTPLHAWQFRLLRILPCRNRDELVHCDLVVADMIEPIKAAPGVGLRDPGDIVEYEAISYTWGSAEFSASIACNGVDLPVTVNAREVLWYLRLPDKSRYVWIDSICINQLNTQEKNSQVQNVMFRIYRRAKRVLGYLDRRPRQATCIVELLDTLNRRNTNTWERIRSAPTYYCEHPNHESAQGTSQIIADRADELLQNCSFFRRTWIRQELFAAQASGTLLLQSRAHAFAWETLEFLLGLGATSKNQNLLDAHQYLTKLRTSIRLDAHQPEQNTKKDSNNVWTTLILQNADSFESSLAVDRIYAMYNIAHEAGALPDGAPLDYGLSFLDAYSKFFAFIGQTQLGVLLFSVFEDMRDRSDDLPSYTIDIRKPKPRICLQLRSKSLHEFRLCDPADGVSHEWIQEVAPSEERNRERLLRALPKTIPRQPLLLTGYQPVLLCAIKLGQLGSRIAISRYDEPMRAKEILGIGTHANFVPYGIQEVTQESLNASLETKLSAIESLSYNWFGIDNDTLSFPVKTVGLADEGIICASSEAGKGDILVAANRGWSNPAGIIVLRPEPAFHGSDPHYRYMGPCLCFSRTALLSKQQYTLGFAVDINRMLLEYFWIV